jgi:hypothetical protein
MAYVIIVPYLTARKKVLACHEYAQYVVKDPVPAARSSDAVWQEERAALVKK